jgi:hypothetical protein
MKKQNNPSLKARLLRGAIYVLLAVCAVPFALAQPCSVTASCPSLVFNQPTIFDINISESVDPTTVQASDFTVNGTPADNVTLLNGNMTIEFTFNTSPVVLGHNTMHIAAGAFNCALGEPVAEFTCTFSYRVLPTPRPRPTIRPPCGDCPTPAPPAQS